MPNFELVADNLMTLQHKVKNLTQEPIDIIAVTKTFSHEIYDLCFNLGITHVGENKAQELKTKFELGGYTDKKKLKYHFIGHLQTNKIKDVIGIISSLDTLQSIKQVNKLKKLCLEEDIHNLPVLLQVNSTNEVGKSGIFIRESKQLFDIAHRCLEDNFLSLEGLMTIGPTPTFNLKTDKKEDVRNTQRAFSETRKTQEILCKETGCRLSRLSMGMSNDYQIAIEEGSTEIRLGTLLFGKRPIKQT